MRRRSLHTTLALMTLAVMMLTSTGFTAVIRYCTMTESSECCCESAEEQTQTAAAAGPAITTADMPCVAQTIAGGRNEIDATLHGTDAQKVQALDVISYACEAVSDALPGYPLTIHSTDDPAPPGVGIYIRVNSLLI